MSSPRVQGDRSLLVSWAVQYQDERHTPSPVQNHYERHTPSPSPAPACGAGHAPRVRDIASDAAGAVLNTAEQLPLSSESDVAALDFPVALAAASAPSTATIFSAGRRGAMPHRQVRFELTFVTQRGEPARPVDGTRLALPSTLPFADSAQLAITNAEAAAASAAGARYVRVSLVLAEDSTAGNVGSTLQPPPLAADGPRFTEHVLSSAAALLHPDTVEVRCPSGDQYACCYVGEGLLATAGCEGTICLVDAGTGAIVRQLQGKCSDIWALGMWPAVGCLVACYDDGALECWDTRSWTATQIPSPGGTCDHGSVLPLTDGRLAVSGFESGCVYVYSPGETAAPLELFSGVRIFQLAQLPTGLLAGAGFDGRVHVWDLTSATSNPRWVLGAVSQPLYALCALSDGRLVSASCEGPSALTLWTPQATPDGFGCAPVVADSAFAFGVRALQLASGIVAVTSYDTESSAVLLMDPVTWRVLHTLPGGIGLGAAALPDGRLAVATSQAILYIYGTDSDSGPCDSSA